jgi:hypothetical protein
MVRSAWAVLICCCVAFWVVVVSLVHEACR